MFSRLFVLLVTVFSTVTWSGAVWAGSTDVVVIHEGWHDVDPGVLQKRADLLAGLIAKAVGWKPKQVRGHAFTNLAQGLAHVKTHKPGYVLASARVFAHLYGTQKMTVVAHAVLPEDDVDLPRLIARRDSSASVNLHQMPGFTLASAVDGDMQWLNVLFDGTMRTEQHFNHLSVVSLDDAVAAVAEGRADLALIDEVYRKSIEPRFRGNNPELKIAYSAIPLPPPALLAMNRFARKPDVKKLTTAVKELCNKDGRRACLELGFFRLNPGPHPSHPHLAYKYAHYK